MAENTVQKRLSKVALEFNVGISTIVEFLLKKGLAIDSNPNTKVPENFYQLLRQEYAGEKSVKEKSQKISIGTVSKKQTITIDEASESDRNVKSEEDPKELLIRNVHNLPLEEEPAIKKKPESTMKIIGKMDLGKGKKPIETEQKPEPVIFEQPVAPIVEVRTEEKPVPEAEKALAEKTSDLKILGKMELADTSKKKKTRKSEKEVTKSKAKTKAKPETEVKTEKEDIVEEKVAVVEEELI
ncbi:MAG: hypothetical protein KKA07_10155, partial [Bacteroidetes bacterium]|nr:hypothetical protein [Bacteroidota bacterium]